MDAITTRLIEAGILFLGTIISGIIVGRFVRHLSLGPVTLHKLIGAGAILLLGMAIKQLFKTVDGNGMTEVSLTVIVAISSRP